MASDPDQPMLRPALLAAALAPLCAELLTATAPPRTFFDPLPAWYRLLLYGSGVLVVHECAVTWKRGWPGLLLLGLAFGTVVEGLVSRSMFCTEWLRIGLLGDYGHWLGINWHWSLLLLVFHAVYSIALPVLVAELVWPDSRNRHWLDPAVTQMLVMGLLAGALTAGRMRCLPRPRASGSPAVYSGVGSTSPATPPHRAGRRAASTALVALPLCRGVDRPLAAGTGHATETGTRPLAQLPAALGRGVARELALGSLCRGLDRPPPAGGDRRAAAAVDRPQPGDGRRRGASRGRVGDGLGRRAGRGRVAGVVAASAATTGGGPWLL